MGSMSNLEVRLAAYGMLLDSLMGALAKRDPTLARDTLGRAEITKAENR